MEHLSVRRKNHLQSLVTKTFAGISLRKKLDEGSAKNVVRHSFGNIREAKIFTLSLV